MRFNEVLQRYAMERWLFRLSASEHANSFVLKGALMLATWGLPVIRSTKDIDMLARVENDLHRVRELIVAICAVDVGDDGLTFDTDSVTTERIAEDALYDGVRSSFRGNLGNARIAMQIDLGFSDVITPGPVDLIYPTLLDQSAPKLLAYNRETAIAEKLEAMVKLGELNSRMKDFFDVWTMARSETVDLAVLAKAIKQTFARRNTSRANDAACFAASFGESVDKQQQWRAFLRRSRLIGDVPDAFVDVWREVIAYLLPLMDG